MPMSRKKVRIYGDKNAYLSASQGYKKELEETDKDKNDTGCFLIKNV